MGKTRTDAQRADDRERKRRSRANIAAKEEEQELVELRQRDPETARIQELFQEVFGNYEPQFHTASKEEIERYKQEQAAISKLRNDKFDREKAEGDRKSLEYSKFCMFLYAHGIPFSYGPALFPDGIPADKKFSSKKPEELNDGQI